MIVVLDENNKLILTEKALFIKDFRDLYNYYNKSLGGHDKAMAAFGIMYYMFFFDSPYLLDYPDEEERFKEVQKFVYKGEEISKIKLLEKAFETYKNLMDLEQVSLYLVMRNNVTKVKVYAENMVLGKKNTGGKKGEEDQIRDTTDIPVTFGEFQKVNSSLPNLEEELRLFKDRLMKFMKSSIDIYGGGEQGAYE